MNSRIYYFDILNVISCIAVLALHHNGIVHTFDGSSAWCQALGVEVLFYWAVPVFFMLSGATLINYRERYDTKTFLKKRFVRTLIPFLIWSIIWCLLNCVKDHNIPSVIEVLDGILHCKYQGVYWFFFPLFSIYLLMPVLSLLKDKVNVLKYLCLLIFVCDGIINPICHICDFETIPGLKNPISGPLMYVILGWLISKDHLFNEINKYLKVLIILSLLCFGLRYWVTYSQSFALHNTYRGLFNYYYFTAVIPSVTIFVLVKKWFGGNLSERWSNVLVKMSSCSFGIYLVHMGVLVLWSFLFNRTSLYFRILTIPFTYFICFVVVYIIKKVKIARFVFP